MLTSDLRTIAQLLRPSSPSGRHADRLEHFYRGQASGYDAFRERLLPGRRELIQGLPLHRGAVWIDLGGGTANNLRYLGPALATLANVYVVDLTSSLLAVARDRCARERWTNVQLIRGDATAVALPDGVADVVTCSYALTMIPDWRAAIHEALRLLKPGGTFASVDFYVSRPVAAPLVQHAAVTRVMWPWWFKHSHVHLSAEHLPYLHRRFLGTSLTERRTRLPYLPVGRVPYYRFVGTSPGFSHRA